MRILKSLLHGKHKRVKEMQKKETVSQMGQLRSGTSYVSENHIQVLCSRFKNILHYCLSHQLNVIGLRTQPGTFIAPTFYDDLREVES